MEGVCIILDKKQSYSQDAYDADYWVSYTYINIYIYINMPKCKKKNIERKKERKY